MRYRITCIKNFTSAMPDEAVHIEVKDKEEGMRILNTMANTQKFQSDQYPIPMLNNVAALEYFDEKENEWLFV